MGSRYAIILPNRLLRAVKRYFSRTRTNVRRLVTLIIAGAPAEMFPRGNICTSTSGVSQFCFPGETESELSTAVRGCVRASQTSYLEGGRMDQRTGAPQYRPIFPYDGRRPCPSSLVLR